MFPAKYELDSYTKFVWGGGNFINFLKSWTHSYRINVQYGFKIQLTAVKTFAQITFHFFQNLFYITLRIPREAGIGQGSGSR